MCDHMKHRKATGHRRKRRVRMEAMKHQCDFQTGQSFAACLYLPNHFHLPHCRTFPVAKAFASPRLSLISLWISCQHFDFAEIQWRMITANRACSPKGSSAFHAVSNLWEKKYPFSLKLVKIRIKSLKYIFFQDPKSWSRQCHL